LGEVAADNDEVRVSFIHLPLNGVDYRRVMRSEVEVRKMNQTSHGGRTLRLKTGSTFSSL
jgi:hypothetical protein